MMMKGYICQIKKYLRSMLIHKKSCLSEKKKNEVMDILYKYKDALTLRDEIGTCPNIDVEI